MVFRAVSAGIPEPSGAEVRNLSLRTDARIDSEGDGVLLHSKRIWQGQAIRWRIRSASNQGPLQVVRRN